MSPALLALLAAAAPVPPPTLNFETFRLDNGLTVILHEDHAAPLVAVHVQYDVGSKDEKPGRTGFAHLFEHLMFQATAHLAKGEMDRVVESAGGDSNGSTSQDATVYWATAPSSALEQLLYVESERMGFLLPALTQENLDNQRDVVRNERRQNYEMRPYGTASLKLFESLWDPEFPYHWPTIGSHQDLEAATLEDVREFFTRWYGPGNAVLVVAGDLEPARARSLVQKWFGDVPARAPVRHEQPVPRPLEASRRVTLEDEVQLPRVYLAWQSPALFQPGDAALDVLGAILSDGKSSRLVRRLVMEEQTAQEVFAGQSSRALASAFLVVATPKPGVPVDRIERAVDEEIARIAKEPPTAEELQRAKNKIESSAVFALEPLGGFEGRAARLADYYLLAGDPGYLDEDLARYGALTAADVSGAARRWLAAPRVSLTVVPRVDERDPGAAPKETTR